MNDATGLVHAPTQATGALSAGGALRIAVITETWPPEVNGVAMSISRVVEGLLDRHHAVQLIRPRQRESRPQSNALSAHPGLEEILSPSLPIPGYASLRMGLAFGLGLKRRWLQHPPDVVHLATEGPLGWWALQVARSIGLPVSSDFRTNFHAYSTHYGLAWLHKPIARYLCDFHNKTRLTMVPTEGLRQQLRERGFRNVEVVARGVDTVQFHPDRRSLALRQTWGVHDPCAPVVACVGRLAAEKNLGLVLEAFAAMRAVRADAKLLFVGDGPLRDELLARCPDAIFAGQRSGTDLAAHYASADLFLFPSLTETFGNVTSEAMASGLPVLAFDYAGAAQLIDHTQTGHLVPFGDAAGFVRAAASMASQPEACRAVGVRARSAVQALGWDGIVSQFEARLQGLRSDRPDASQGAEWPMMARTRHFKQEAR